MYHSSRRSKAVLLAVIFTAVFSMVAGLILPAVSMADNGSDPPPPNPPVDPSDSTGSGSSLPGDSPDGYTAEEEPDGASLWDVIVIMYTITI